MNQTQFSLVVLGDPIIDISAEVEERIIKKYNLEYGQTVFVNDENKKCFEEIERNPKVKYIAGGALQNSLKVCAWVLNLRSINKNLQSEGQPVHKKFSMLGCVGNDTHGRKLEKCLTELGISPIFEVHPTLPTSSCAVAVCNKERSLLTNLQASTKLSKGFIKEKLEEIEEHDVLAIEGYFIKENFSLCRFLAEKFKHKNKKIILTLSAAFMLRNHFEQMLEIANFSDVIFCNICEAKEFAKKNESEDIEEIMLNVHKQLSISEGRLVVCTNGENGAYVSTFNPSIQFLDILIHVPAKRIPPSEIVDFNAAGDAFAGGFLAGLFRGLSLNECAHLGNEASGKIIRVSGSDLDSIEKFEQ